MYGGCSNAIQCAAENSSSAIQCTIENIAEPMCQCLGNCLCGFCKCVLCFLSGGTFDGGDGGDGGGGCGGSKWIVWLDRQRKQKNDCSTYFIAGICLGFLYSVQHSFKSWWSYTELSIGKIVVTRSNLPIPNCFIDWVNFDQGVPVVS